MDRFDHLVEITEKDRMLTIYRANERGEKVLYTSVELPHCSIETDEGMEQFKEFAKMLGENILLDSPVARRIYNL